MKRSNITKLAAAIAAAAMMTTAIAQQNTPVLDPQNFLQEVQNELALGQRIEALATVDELRAIGVTSIVIANEEVTLDELAGLITSNEEDALELLRRLLEDAIIAEAEFGVSTPLLLPEAQAGGETFPVGSAG